MSPRAIVTASLAFCALFGSFADEVSTNGAPLVAKTAAGVAQPSGLPPFSHYEVILNRKPFGDVAKVVEAAPDKTAEEEQAAAEQAKEEQALAKQIDMVAVNRTPRGKVAVGFIDKGEKPPRNYYLNVGDSGGGFTVVSADFTEETATIEKDGISITLKLGKGIVPKKDGEGEDAAVASSSASPSPSIAAPSPAPSSFSNRPMLRPGIRPGGLSQAGQPNGRPGTPGAARGYLSNLRQRNAAATATRDQATAAEVAKLREEINAANQKSKEDAAKREREINLELISKGQEPLSLIELTPEEDAKLVREGVLAPE